MVDANAPMEAIATAGVGRIQYGALRQRGSSVLRVAWRFRVSQAGRWFTCGELVPNGKTYAVRGWDGQLVGRVTSIRDGL